MDQKEMMERLKRDPAALQAVMGSRDGQMLLGLLSGSDGGRTLQQGRPPGGGRGRLRHQRDASGHHEHAPGGGPGAADRRKPAKIGRRGGSVGAGGKTERAAVRSQQHGPGHADGPAAVRSHGGAEGGPAAPCPAAGPDLGAALGGLDPKLLGKLLPLAGELGTENSAALQLLQALRPFLKEEKQGKIERAARLARLIHVGKKLLADWEG